MQVDTTSGISPGTRLDPALRSSRALASTAREIPYDYVATFALTGVRGNRLQEVINISIDGPFIAVALSYSFLPASTNPPPELSNGVPLRKRYDHTLEGFNALRGATTGATTDFPQQLLWATERFIADGVMVQRLMAHLMGVDFLYSLIDSGSGRELQNLPIHNLAGLGNAKGDRPFRPFPRPITFQPRSTIRIEVIEQSQGFLYQGATLYMVLQGYKVIGAGAQT